MVGTFEENEKKKELEEGSESGEEKVSDAGSSEECVVRVLAQTSYVEVDAIKQLDLTSKLPNMKYAIGTETLKEAQVKCLGM